MKSGHFCTLRWWRLECGTDSHIMLQQLLQEGAQPPPKKKGGAGLGHQIKDEIMKEDDDVSRSFPGPRSLTSVFSAEMSGEFRWSVGPCFWPPRDGYILTYVKYVFGPACCRLVALRVFPVVPFYSYNCTGFLVQMVVSSRQLPERTQKTWWWCSLVHTGRQTNMELESWPPSSQPANQPTPGGGALWSRSKQF